MSTTPKGTTTPDLTTSADGSFRYGIERIKGSLVRIEVESDADRLRAAADRQFERHNQQAKIPGFRPGKAPRPIYERHYGTQHLWNDAAEDVIDETYREITQRERLEPLDHPQVEIRQLEQGKPLSYAATVTVRSSGFSCSSGIGSPSSAIAARCSAIASCTRSMHCSTVSPWVTTPGRAGTVTV